MTAKSVSLRVSLTDNCQLRCRYCRPATDPNPSSPQSSSLTDGDLFALIRAIHQVKGIGKLRFTGGEPLLRRGLVDLIAACKQLDIPDMALTTNGQRLTGLAADLKGAGLHRLNVSLDSLNKETFGAITRCGDLTATLRGIDEALRLGMAPLKLNTVIMRGINDHEIEAILAYGLTHDCHVRLLELMPIGIAAADFEERFVSCDEIRSRLETSFSFEPLPYQRGSTSQNFVIRDASGRQGLCGFIAPTSHPFCGGCQRLRLTADGRLFGCLAQTHHLDARPALASALMGDFAPLLAVIGRTLAVKNGPHNLAAQSDMAKIGG